MGILLDDGTVGPEPSENGHHGANGHVPANRLPARKAPPRPKHLLTPAADPPADSGATAQEHMSEAADNPYAFFHDPAWEAEVKAAALAEMRQPTRPTREPRSEEEQEEEKEYRNRLLRFLRTLDNAMADRPGFPLDTLPPLLGEYVAACARSIHCPPDLLAVPLLSVAGAATGRSGRRLRVKPGWDVSSCLWTACLTDSSGGKTPALNAVMNFYDDRQEAAYKAYQAALAAHNENSKDNPHPGPYPALVLTDTTIESLRTDLEAGPVLFARDELGGWCHQMGQYKQGNSDRFDWCSFWSHSPVNIGRKTERVYVKEPFVAVAGMMVPGSARELNYRGQADDGFVHRILLAYPAAMRPVATLEGVPDELVDEYKRAMSRLFDPPSGGTTKTVTFEPAALDMVMGWANEELYGELGEYVCTNPDQPAERQEYEWRVTAPGWVVSKYRKLFENCLRLCLVLHELWRVAWHEHEPDECKRFRYFYGTRIEFRPGVVDRVTVERAVSVINYFRAHIGPVQSLLGEEVDDADRVYHRLRRKGTITVREVAHKTTYKQRDRVLVLFAEWERRGYGEVRPGDRANQTVFAFADG